MSNDTTGDLKKLPPETLAPLKNRKLRRMEAAQERKAPKEYRREYYWRLRILNEMKENKAVQEKLMAGDFDYFLPTEDLPE